MSKCIDLVEEISEEKIFQNEIHLLPCNVDFNGPAPIRSYFLVKQNPVDSSLDSHFRGRKLIGKEITLPKHVTGVHAVIGTKESASTSQLETVNTFTTLCQWEHDIAPDSSVLFDCLDYMELSDALHCMEDED